MYGEPSTFFSRIAEKSNLKEGDRGVYRVILELYRRRNKKISNKLLARYTCIPVPVLSAVRGELLKAGFMKTKSLFSETGLDWIQSELMLKFNIDFFEQFIPSSSMEIATSYLEFFSPVIDFLKRRPPPEYKYDQSRSLPETVIKRSLVMLKNGDVEGKKIVLLGDDDGVSLALAYLECAKEILVIDIDIRILDFIESFASEFDRKKILKTQLWDIRSNFPQKWMNRFDVFETDPPYTVSGFKLFIDRAHSLLKIPGYGRGYISFSSKSPQESWVCQQHLLSTGFSIEQFISDFNYYMGATILGNSSNLYIINSNPIKMLRKERKSEINAIYTFDETKVKELPTIGYQIIAEFYGVDSKLLKDAERLRKYLEAGIAESDLHLEEIFVKKYSPYGLSIVAILAESHCHLHTWPEHSYLSLDIFVCEAENKAENLFRYLLHIINPIDFHKFQFYRGKPSIKSEE
ncbi:MAG: adenosylmethionine decarboxylase [Candidatus Heimdallarchaeota archaeon]|nr:adenosylmethionine decarboxylase [Candidatus Heimdallarchaeota archaeon]